MVDENTSLNGTYAAFGKVTEGMDIVDKIVNLETEKSSSEDGSASSSSSSEKPVNPPVISKMTVDTFGVDYGMPKTEKPFDYTSWLMKKYKQNQ